MKTYIYILKDPATTEVRYVGKTKQPNTRLSVHIRASKRHPETQKEEWVNKLHLQSQRPIMEIIEICEGDTWVERECYWIDFYKQQGCNLTNISSGGYGKNDSKPKKRKINRISDTRIFVTHEGRRREQRIIDFQTNLQPLSKHIDQPIKGAFVTFYGIDEIKVLLKDEKEWITISLKK